MKNSFESLSTENVEIPYVSSEIDIDAILKSAQEKFDSSDVPNPLAATNNRTSDLLAEKNSYNNLASEVDLMKIVDADRYVNSLINEAFPLEDASTKEFYFMPQNSESTSDFKTSVSSKELFNVESIRKDFPILSEKINGHQLVWFDNAATTQKPNSVIDRISYYYRHESSNIHRAAHTLAARSTDAYEASRKKVAQFINASSPSEIVFVRGATEGINLVAQSWGRKNIGAGDEILITWLEHHSNIVPWQLLAAEKGAKLVVVPIDEKGQIRLDQFQRLLSNKTKLVSITHVSNALGTVNPVAEMTAMAQRVGAKVLIDGAQAVSHMKVDVQIIKPDFYIFSGHKVFGPTGIGVVYGTPEILNSMPPWQGGGNMIADVTFDNTVYQQAPARFEAGTGNIADAVGLGAAIDYISGIGMENISRYEHQLLSYAQNLLVKINGLRIIGTATEKAGVISFLLEGFKPEEVGEALNQVGIAVRSGHHCAQPALRFFGLEASVRASFGFYNTRSEVDLMIEVLKKLKH